MVTRVILRVVLYIFEQAHRGAISLEPWIHADVARPTSQIIKAVLIIMALFFIAPLILAQEVQEAFLDDIAGRIPDLDPVAQLEWFHIDEHYPSDEISDCKCRAE